MPTIDLSSGTYNRLLQLVTSFEDRPEDVILRLLDAVTEEAPGISNAPAPLSSRDLSSRAAPGSVLPVQEYSIPILQILVEAGGSAPSNDVIDALEERMGEVFTDRDRQRLQSGEIRWRNRARFARLRMKERGLLSDSSHRGIWEITPVGEAYLRLESKEASEG